jgi:hypothetical protein
MRSPKPGPAERLQNLREHRGRITKLERDVRDAEVRMQVA